MARYWHLNGMLKMRLRASCEAGFYAEKLKPFPNLLEPGAFLQKPSGFLIDWVGFSYLGGGNQIKVVFWAPKTGCLKLLKD